MEQRRDQQGRRPDQQQAQQGTRQQQGGQSDARQPQQQDRQGVSGLGDSDKARGMGQQGGGQQGGGAGRGQEHQQDMQRGQQGRQQGGGQAGSGQQQQFDPQGRGQQGGGGGSDSRFADQIRENMEVIDDRGQRCGTVDHIDGDRIKLARSDSPDGQHHYIPLSQVAGIEGNKVRLRERGDNDFGMETRS